MSSTTLSNNLKRRIYHCNISTVFKTQNKGDMTSNNRKRQLDLMKWNNNIKQICDVRMRIFAVIPAHRFYKTPIFIEDNIHIVIKIVSKIIYLSDCFK